MYEGAVQDLIDELGRLPGIGPKSAQRIAFHIMEAESEDMLRLSDAIRTVKEKARTEEELEEGRELLRRAFEKTGQLEKAEPYI